jgi:pimeloyl-ACP methyl ester carboxylesterase
MKDSQGSADVAYLEVSGGRLAYEEHGPETGPLVIGLHGMGDSRASFRFLTPLLVAAGYRVVVVDGRGHGDSSDGWADHSQQAAGGDLVALVRKLGGPATVIGNSSGAGAAAFAAAATDQISSLILISTFPEPPRLNPFLRAAQGLVLRSPRLWGIYFRSLFVTEKPSDLDVYIRNLRASLHRPGGMRAVRELIAPGDRPWREVAAEITAPVLIVHGSKDPDYPDAEAAARASQALLSSAAAVRIEMIEGAGHYPHAEMPDRTAGPILEFLAGIRG